jgi:hypothetical protein
VCVLFEDIRVTKKQTFFLLIIKMELSMKMFMGLMFIVGLVLTIYAFKIAPAVKNCDSKTQNAARGILVMGVMMLSVSTTYMVCGCGMKVHQGTLGMTFVFFMLAVGIVTITLTSIIHSACKDARKDTPILLTFSALTTVVSASYLVYKFYLMTKGKDSRAVEMTKLGF